MRKHGKQIEIYVPYNGKIFDITEADTSKHTTTSLKSALSETREIIALLLSADRISGTGNFNTYPNEGTTACQLGTSESIRLSCIVIAAGSDRVQYNLTVKNDDFDIYCLGYVVKQ